MKKKVLKQKDLEDNFIIPRNVTPSSKVKRSLSTKEQFQEYINSTTNYDHIFIINKNVIIQEDFDIKYKLNNIHLQDKDFIALGYSINETIFTKLSKNNKNSTLLELEYTKKDNYIDDVYCYICSRKYREFIIKNYNDNEIYIDFINNFRLNDSKKYIENNLTFYIYNTNLFIGPTIKDIIVDEQNIEE